MDELLKRDGLTQGVKAKILGANAMRFYGFPTEAEAR